MDLPLLPLPRVLLPGERLVPNDYRPPARSVLDDPGGSLVAVVFEDREGRRTVGTVAIVTGTAGEAGAGPRPVLLGRRRMEIRASTRSGDHEVVSVDAPAEQAGEGLEPLCREVTALARRLLAVSAEAGTGGDVHAAIDDDPVAASYRVASLMRLSSPERQDLLELPVRARLERERAVLAREIQLLVSYMGAGRQR